MITINTYSDYLIAVRNQTATLRVVRTDAINAFEDLRRNNPKKYAEYKARYEESQKPKSRYAKGRAYDRESYMQEHPEIDVEELRKQTKERLKKGSFGFALCFDLPTWLTEENLLKSVD